MSNIPIDGFGALPPVPQQPGQPEQNNIGMEIEQEFGLFEQALNMGPEPGGMEIEAEPVVMAPGQMEIEPEQNNMEMEVEQEFGLLEQALNMGPGPGDMEIEAEPVVMAPGQMEIEPGQNQMEIEGNHMDVEHNPG